MSKYLSIDLESTGLEEDCHLIQLAFVPVDTETKKVYTEMAREYLVKCPSLEELKPTLNSWVIKHNSEMIEQAHQEGIEPSKLLATVTEYFNSDGFKSFFGENRVIMLGKSITALDIPMLHRYLGGEFMRTRFHHHTVDVTCVARAMVDAGILPPGHASGTKLFQFFELKDNVEHTALADSIDMATIYLRMLDLLTSINQQSQPKT